MTKNIIYPQNSILFELFGSEFEFVNSGFSTGEYNMEYDMERVLKCSGNADYPMLRLYGWKPWAVSLGYNQKAVSINTGLCARYGFDIVRRPTGGRAVLHANELTYSFVLPVSKDKTVHEIYRLIHEFLLSNLKKIVPDLGFFRKQVDLNNFYKSSDMSVSCFASSAKYEIEYNGRKLVGSAQRLFGNTLLQHGSILIGSGHELLADVSNFKTGEDRERLKKLILQQSINLEEASARKLSFEDCVRLVESEIY